MHQSFVSTSPPPPTYEDSQAKVQGHYFLIVPAVPGNCQGFNNGTLAPVRFSFMKGGAKSMVVTISLSPQGMAYTRALKSEKSLSPFAFASILVCPQFEAVDTND